MTLLKSWKSYFYVLLLHPTKAMVWIISNSNQDYSLPHINIDQRVWLGDAFLINNMINQKFGIAVNILHYVSFQINQKQKIIQGIYVLELQDLPETINQEIWCDRQTLGGITFTNSEQKSLIEAYLIELETANIHQLRPPWTQPGWYDRASNWIAQELERLGYQQIAPIECIKTWSISCILKVQSTVGTLYFKQASTLPLFCDEPVVTTELSNLFPNHIPKVISINREHHWLLLQDFGEPIGNQVSLKIKQNIYHLLAKIQIQSVEYRDRLLAVGCLDRRLNCLQSQIYPLMEDAATLSELSSAEITQLQNLVPALKNLCLQLGRIC